MKKLLFLLFFIPILGNAQIQKIENFVVKENLSGNGKLAIIAVDSTEKTNENINGTYKFSINGFTQDLQFHDGIGVPDDKIESSTFVFFKHKNQEKSKGRLFYVYKSEKGLSTFAISGLMFLIIPGVILLIAYAFKKLLVTAMVLAVAFFFFNHSQGLNISSIIESIFASLKNLIF